MGATFSQTAPLCRGCGVGGHAPVVGRGPQLLVWPSFAIYQDLCSVWHWHLGICGRLALPSSPLHFLITGMKTVTLLPSL